MSGTVAAGSSHLGGVAAAAGAGAGAGPAAAATAGFGCNCAMPAACAGAPKAESWKVLT